MSYRNKMAGAKNPKRFMVSEAYAGKCKGAVVVELRNALATNGTVFGSWRLPELLGAFFTGFKIWIKNGNI